ncbi:MAG TPA: hypothetical protein VMS60_10975 [Solirubrobacterales bacterium]|nr:hypothetical protein [Solirubrobacterales bacterium]
MRELDRDDDFVARNGVPVGEQRPPGRRRFVSREVFARTIACLPREDYEQYKAEADALFDPTPREWPDDA